MKYVFSKQGQEVVVKDGYFPVTAELARRQLDAGRHHRPRGVRD